MSDKINGWTTENNTKLEVQQFCMPKKRCATAVGGWLFRGWVNCLIWLRHKTRMEQSWTNDVSMYEVIAELSEIENKAERNPKAVFLA